MNYDGIWDVPLYLAIFDSCSGAVCSTAVVDTDLRRLGVYIV